MKSFINSLVDIFLGWDLWVATLIVLCSNFFINPCILNSNASGIYSVAISVLSVVFSVFFAMFAIIVVSPDKAFVSALEEGDNVYSEIVQHFKTTLRFLFTGLISITGLFIYTKTLDESGYVNFAIFNTFLFVFSYSLLCTFISVNFTFEIIKRQLNFKK